ncbi:MAG: radical SAM family heme chaperone HemW [Ginsengibacter sp.]
MFFERQKINFKSLAGIYIHIPFCKQACYYCNFHFSTSLHFKKEMLESIRREIEMKSTFSTKEREQIETVYFGGGTPSLLSSNDIEFLFSAIKENYDLAKDAEITMEANPDDISEENLASWKKLGINRLSIGIQSFAERDLQWMNRAHNANQALSSIEMAREAGFDNFSVDLIFGTPGLSDEEWKSNLQKVIELNVPHISSYALTVEPKTPLQKMINLHKKENVNGDLQANQFLIEMKMLKKAGYENYEISNFAKPGFRSRHNSSYWQGKSYIGFGPSAHSFNGEKRTWNVANNSEYIKSIQQNILPSEEEILTKSQKINEYVMTSLRTIEGLDLNYIESWFSLQQKNRVNEILKLKIDPSNYERINEKIILTDSGKLIADRISVELFI